MNSTLRKFTQAGFTLVELLIVVIILAILAAIVIPQFSSSTKDAQESALDANLAALRSAIELYKVQHNSYPGAVASSGGTCPTGGTASTPGALNTAGAFTDQLLMYTNLAGQACTVGDVTYKFGPYLRKGIPADPINSNATVVVTDPATGAPLTTAVTTGGWKVDTKSGQIIMNSNDKDSKWTATSPTLYSSH